MSVDEGLINQIILEYITKVNSNWRSNVFTSARLAKIALEQLGYRSTRFPIIHSIIRKTLGNLAEKGFCTYLTTTKLGRCRKTKDVYKFDYEGIRWIKLKLIEESIKGIRKEHHLRHLMLRTREKTIDSLLAKIVRPVL